MRAQRTMEPRVQAGRAAAAEKSARVVGSSDVDAADAVGPPDEVLEATATEIHACTCRRRMELFDAVGKIVLDRLYGGDVDEWRRHGRKDVSLRRLAERLHGRTGWSAAGLSRCVWIHCFLQAHESIRRLETLTPKHLNAVRGLSESDQVAFLEQAHAEGWSASALADRVCLRLGRKRTGRPRRLGFERVLRSIEQSIERGELFRDLDRVANLSLDVVEKLHIRVTRAEEQLDRLKMRLRRAASRGRVGSA